MATANSGTDGRGIRSLRSSVTHAPVPMALFDEDGRFLVLSDRWLELCGPDYGQRSMLDWLSLAYGRRAEAVMRYVRERAETDPAGVVTEIGFQTDARRRQEWSCVTTLVGVDSDGRRLFLLVARELSRRSHRPDDGKREINRRARELLEALPVAIYTTDPHGKLTFYNSAAVDFWGWRPELGSDQWDAFQRQFFPEGAPLPHGQCPLVMTLKEKRPIRGAEVLAERADGTRLFLQPYPTPMHDATGKLVGAVNMLVDITSRKEADDRLKLMAREVDHRANNLISLTQAIVRLAEAPTAEELKAVIEGRIGALAQVHGLLAQTRWVGADLQRLVEEEVAPYRGGQCPQVEVKGPALVLEPHAAQSMAIALHELATNAAKYGALSTPAGRVVVEWKRTTRGGLIVRWAESGGPKVSMPSRRGFGTGAIDGTVCKQLEGDVRFDWRASGLVCSIRIPIIHQRRRGGPRLLTSR